jgi:formylglycine-generating enzyme required for sulfatase activity
MGGNPWRWGLKRPLDRSKDSRCGPNCPEGRVSWEDVQQFVATLNERLDGYTYRLPTEAEWEYAARAGTTGDYAGDLYGLGWHLGNSDMEERPSPVGRRQPNPWGLYDMHGNVWEWVSDWYASSYPSSPVTDPTGPAEGKYKVYRGGSWAERFGECRSANRSWGGPGGRDFAVGFRILRVKPSA